MAVEVPEEQLRSLYQCADCALEGLGPKPGSEYNWVKAARYKGGVRRLPYCKVHQSARNGAAQKKRMQRPEAKQKRRAWFRANWTRYRAANYAASRAYYQRKREERAAQYREWVAANPEKRKASQDAWRQRQRLRGRPSVVVGGASWRERRRQKGEVDGE